MQGPTYTAAELLARLVAFDTTSHKSNIELIRFVEDYLAQHGVASHLVPTTGRQKASLFATIGPTDIPGIGLSGHTDVVPVDPRSMGQRSLHRCRARRPALWPRHLRHEGVSRLRARCRAGLPAAQAQDADSHRLLLRRGGGLHRRAPDDRRDWAAACRSRASSSSASRHPWASSTPTRVRCAGRSTSRAARRIRAWRISASTPSPTPRGCWASSSRIEEELREGPPDPRFDPPYPTLQVTEIEGGTASNIVPLSCRFGFEVRALPGARYRRDRTAPAAFRRDALPSRDAPRCAGGRDHHSPAEPVPPFEADPRSEAVALALKLVGQQRDARRLLRHRGRPVSGRGRAVGRLRARRHRPGAHRQRVDRQRPARSLHGFLGRLADWAEA